MDNNKLEGQLVQYPECSCEHGMCKNHNPEWKNIGEKQYEPDPVVMLGISIKIHLFKICCGRSMARYKIVQKQKCKKCGRNRNFVENCFLALCLCCGHRKTFLF